MKTPMSSLFQWKEMTFLETANSKPNCKQQTAAASIFAHHETERMFKSSREGR